MRGWLAILVVMTVVGMAPLANAEPAAKTAATQRLPGVSLAEGLSQLTGVAISPMLGVSAVGAWHYWHTPATVRDRLPWYCHPWAWGIGLGVIGLCFLKDTLGPATPLLIKKPLDMLEVFEDKVSALIASAAFIPFLAEQMSGDLKEIAPPVASVIGGFSATLPMGQHAMWLLLPLGLGVFAVVWLVSHAIHVLIALCPFKTVDTLLKLAKTGLLAVFTLVAMLHPYVGAALSVVLIAIAALLAPTAFRLMVLGSVFGKDMLFPWIGRDAIDTAPIRAFATGGRMKAPGRVCGRVERNGGGIPVFRYRPWLVLPRREIPLHDGPVVVVRGLVFPSLEGTGDGGGQRCCLLPPRYRGREERLAARIGARGVRDNILLGGLKAVRAWFAGMWAWARA